LIQNKNGRHDQVVAAIKKMPFPVHNKEFVGRQVCTVDNNGDFLVAVVPFDDFIDYGMKTRAVRGVTRALMRLTPCGELQ